MANFTGLAAGRARRSCAGPAGTSSARGWPARRGSGCWSAPSGTTPSTWRCATSGSARPSGRRPTTRGGSGSTRSRRRSDGRARPDDRVPAGGQRALRRLRPVRRGDRSCAHEHGAWVHVDGAFGLWAAASPDAYAHLVDGVRGGRLLGHRRAQDAQRALRLRHRDRRRSPARSGRRWACTARYLIQAPTGDPFDKVPEMSRRARAVPVWAVLRSLGRIGRRRPRRRPGCATPRDFRRRHRRHRGREVLNDVVFTQVCRLRRRRADPGRSSPGCSRTARPG